MGLTAAAIGHLEAGRVRVSLPDVDRLATALRMSPAELLSRLGLTLTSADLAPDPVDQLHRALAVFLGPDRAGDVAQAFEHALSAIPALETEDRDRLAEGIVALAEYQARKRLQPPGDA